MGFHEKPTIHVGHVKVKVSNVPQALQFYQKIVGFNVLEQTATTAQLTVDGKTSILSIEQPKNVVPKEARTTGLYHFAILLPKRADLANFVVHLLENQIRFGSSDHLVSEALYFHDPDGNQIEVYADRSPSEWTWEKEEVAMTVDPLHFDNLIAQVTASKWIGMPEQTVLGHIHLHVAELQKTEAFYVKGLGLQVVSRFGEQAVFLSDNKYHHHVAVNIWNGLGAPRPTKNSVGLDFYTLVYANEEVRQEVVRRLQGMQYDVLEENGYFQTEDPSGNVIRLLV